MVHRVAAEGAVGVECAEFDEPSALFRGAHFADFGKVGGATVGEVGGIFLELEGELSFHDVGLESFWTKVADDCVRVADGDLDVRFPFDASAFECGFAFLKYTAHGLEWDAFGAFDCGNGVVEDEAVAVAAEPVVVAFASPLVFWKRLADGGKVEF